MTMHRLTLASEEVIDIWLATSPTERHRDTLFRWLPLLCRDPGGVAIGPPTLVSGRPLYTSNVPTIDRLLIDYYFGEADGVPWVDLLYISAST
jgi:hypothetical protein